MAPPGRSEDGTSSEAAEHPSTVRPASQGLRPVPVWVVVAAGEIDREEKLRGEWCSWVRRVMCGLAGACAARLQT
jgi:hypothetical protein